MSAPRPIVVVAAAAVLAAAALALLSLLGGPDDDRRAAPRAEGGAVPRDFFGIVTEDAFARPGRYRSRALARQARTGVGLIRQVFDWSQIERRPGRYDFAGHDEFAAALAAERLELLPVLLRAPRFHARVADAVTSPPRSDEDMARFAAALARRYGPGGSFWRSHPDLPRMPIRAWQVWNEPSLPQYWPTGPDAAEYVNMLRVVGAALRREDPDAEIVTAGLPDSRLGVPFDEYLPAMYEAGAREAFDTLAVHPYAADADASLAAVERARSIVRAHSDDPPIWVTEIGWASGGPPSAFTVGEQGQADRIRRAVRLLTERRTRLGLRGLVYYNWRDAVPYPPDFKDFFGLHTGLLTLAGTPKPALEAFATAIERRRAGAATCQGASC